MKKNIKAFVSGMVVMLVIMSTITAFGAPVKKNIQAMVDSIKTIAFNGNSTAAAKGSQVITYNNVTYVPITAISNAMYKNVKWDSKSGKLDISGIKISNAERDAIYKAMELNIKHFNDKDIEGFMSDYSSAIDATMLEATRNTISTQFNYDISQTIKSKSIIAYDGKTCELRVTLEVKQGSTVAGNVTAVQKLVKEKGKWKISFAYNEKMGR